LQAPQERGYITSQPPAVLARCRTFLASVVLDRRGSEGGGFQARKGVLLASVRFKLNNLKEKKEGLGKGGGGGGGLQAAELTPGVKDIDQFLI
jgi:hypothetical protein